MKKVWRNLCHRPKKILTSSSAILQIMLKPSWLMDVTSPSGCRWADLQLRCFKVNLHSGLHWFGHGQKGETRSLIVGWDGLSLRPLSQLQLHTHNALHFLCVLSRFYRNSNTPHLSVVELLTLNSWVTIRNTIWHIYCLKPPGMMESVVQLFLLKEKRGEKTEYR